jgi:hypothetical protein
VTDYSSSTSHQFNANGHVIESHGMSTSGSAQNDATSDKYYFYNGILLTGWYLHTTSNVSESHTRLFIYYYLPLNAIVTVNNASCPGCNDGSIIINASNGVLHYNYSSDPVAGNQTGNIFDSLVAGTYLISVIDSIGNVVSINVTITEPGVSVQAINGKEKFYFYSDENGSVFINNTNEILEVCLYTVEGKLLGVYSCHSGKTIFRETEKSALLFYHVVSKKQQYKGQIINR